MDLTTQKEKETEIIDRVFFIAGMLGVLVVALCVIWWKVTGKSPIPPVPPCMIHAVTGIYCPGCGGRAAVWKAFVIALLPSDRALHGGGRSSFSGHADDRAFEPRTIPGSGAFQTRLSLDRAGAGGDQLLCEKLHTAVFSYSIALTGKYTIGKGVINFF